MLHVQKRRDDRQDQPALVDAGGLQGRDREDIAGIRAEVIPIEDDHQELGAQQPGQRAVDHQIRDQFVLMPVRRASFSVTHRPARNASATRTP